MKQYEFKGKLIKTFDDARECVNLCQNDADVSALLVMSHEFAIDFKMPPSASLEFGFLLGERHKVILAEHPYPDVDKLMAAALAFVDAVIPADVRERLERLHGALDAVHKYVAGPDGDCVQCGLSEGARGHV